MSASLTPRILTALAALAIGVVAVVPSARALADSRDRPMPEFPTLREFARDHNGGTLDWVPSTGVPKASWKRAMNDETVRVDPQGDAFVIEASESYPDAAAVAAAGAPLVHSDIATANAFLLHSNPTSNRTIYLDFTGMDIAGTAWASGKGWSSSQTTFRAYDIDGNTATFSTTERQNIIDAWSNVAEDFAMFDVDVTTEEPSQSRIDRASFSDQTYGTRALITTGSNVIADSCACGGVAYLSTFDTYGVPSGYYTPAFAFAATWFNGKIISDIVSHEVGHNLGLQHDGFGSDAYYLGRSGWAPIMGAGYYQPLVQWSTGDYGSANQTQDDFGSMRTHGLNYYTDDAGDSRVTAVSVTGDSVTNGIIATRSDVDYFGFTATRASYDVNVTSPATNGDLDVQLTVYDSSGTVVDTVNPAMARTDDYTLTGLDASTTFTASVGATYYLKIDGVGQGDPQTTGYSDYGSVGQYILDVSPSPLPDLTLGTPTISGTGVFGTSLTGSAGTWPSGSHVTTEWFRNGVGTADIDETFTPTADDIGATITFRVTATKSGYNDALVTSSPVAVSAATFSLTPTPSISGTGVFGTSLVASTGSWDPGVTPTITWLRNGNETSNHSLTYDIGSSEIGARISFRAVGTKPGYTTVIRTSSSVTATAATITPTGTPTIAGKVKVGKTVEALAGEWMDGVSFTYQWQRNGLPISAATAPTYKLTRRDEGKRISVTLSVTRVGFTRIVVSSAQTAKVAR